MASALASCSRSSVGSSVDRPSRSRKDGAAASRSLLGSTFKHGEGVLRCSSGRGAAAGERDRKLLVTAKRVAFVEPPEVLDRFRLNNLAPQPGSRKRNKRKGRGHSAGQGGSCGAGMRGQKSRAGPKVRPGFEGGQMPLYRRIPKLRGIAGGMRAGVPKYIPVNLKDIAEGFSNGEEVSLETLTSKRMINPSGKDKKLPLKILGDGDEEFKLKLSIKARAFSKSAKEKLEAAGCTIVTLPGPKKWVKPSVAKNIKRAEDYFARKKGLVAPSEES